MSPFAHATVRTKLRGMVAVLGAALLGCALTAFFGLARLSDLQDASLDSMHRGMQAEDLARSAQVSFKIQIQEWKNILLRGQDPDQFAKYKAAFLKEQDVVEQKLTRLRDQVQEFEVPTSTVEAILKESKNLSALYMTALQSYASGKADSHRVVDALVKGKDRALTEAIDRLVEQILKGVEADRAEHTRLVHTGITTTRTVLGGVTLVGLALGLALSGIILSSVTGPLSRLDAGMAAMAKGDLRQEVQVTSQDELGHIAQAFNQLVNAFKTAFRDMNAASSRVASGSTELSAAADEISSTTAEIAHQNEIQRATTDQMAAAMTELSVSIEEVSTNVRRAEERTQGAVKAAEAGSAQGERTHQAMEAMAETTGQMVAAVRVIQDIARQTNLLSLNAAIEAAKAGVHGKGFAVVAEEVRKLAERSGQAAREIGQLIERTNAAMQEGRSTVGATVQTLGTIQDHVADVSSMILEIGHAASEQARTAQEVARQVDEMAGETANRAAASTELAQTVQEINRAAQELSHVSEALAGSVRRFQI